MSILYLSIVSNSIIYEEYPDSIQYKSILYSIVNKFEKHGIINYKNNYIGYRVNNDIAYVCICKELNADLISKVLDELQNNPVKINDIFNNFNKIMKLTNEIKDVNNIMVNNLEKVINRGENISLLMNKSENLELNAIKFKRNSKKLLCDNYWKQLKLILIMLLMVGLSILILIFMICGIKIDKC